MPQSRTGRPIIIDTDPGQDDAIALLLALASPELDVLGITAVAGNVPLALTEKNARKVCELAGRPEAKVFAGCARPLVRRPVTAEQVRSEEHTSELQSLMRISYSVFCLTKKQSQKQH